MTITIVHSLKKFIAIAKSFDFQNISGKRLVSEICCFSENYVLSARYLVFVTSSFLNILFFNLKPRSVLKMYYVVNNDVL